MDPVSGVASGITIAEFTFKTCRVIYKLAQYKKYALSLREKVQDLSNVRSELRSKQYWSTCSQICCVVQYGIKAICLGLSANLPPEWDELMKTGE